MFPHVWVIAFAAAISVVFVEGSLFSRWRSMGPMLWREWATCPLCVGVWIGALSQIVNYSGSLRFLGVDAWGIAKATLLVLGTGCLSGVAALLYHRVVMWFDCAAARDELAMKLLLEKYDKSNS